MSTATLPARYRRQQSNSTPEDVLGPSGGFPNLTAQLAAIREAELTRCSSSVKPIDPRLIALNQRQAGSSEAVPADGGFLIGPQFAGEIMRRAYDTGAVLRRCFQATTVSNTFAFPAFREGARTTGQRFGGLQFYLENEAAALTESKPQFERHDLTMRKFIGAVYLSDELLRDSDAMGSWLPYALSTELSFTLENQIIRGGGGAEFTGILGAPCTITVPAENNQQAASITSGNVSAMLSRLWEPSTRSSGCVWLHHAELLPSLAALETLVGLNGGSEARLFHWSESPDLPNMLAGLPCYSSELCSAPGEIGDLILADFQRFLLVTRETRSALSLHVRFLTDEGCFRLVCRAAGSPIDSSQITPATGSLTRSPFVVLAART